ncbi:hypothetical protein JR316_0005641 [Psilocybe cubensis]|uniref:Crinkler effector protein N-terminal domain-containing protein n=2 Tax=Psilocybe cubensis TaxID=181762 RepID=A0A8H7XY51_PSICU|nr:hypothetical protein JR316_0005641 [Psilocybe cubensis]KAH9481121.1 hypothetical protein JR316_0005641 [Psilocybe cubensis]
MALRLNCLVHGDDRSGIFTVRVFEGFNVAKLKGAILSHPRFSHLDDLDLRHVSGPFLINDVGQKDLNIDNYVKLSNDSEKNSSIFEDISNDCLHILIGRVSTGLNESSIKDPNESEDAGVSNTNWMSMAWETRYYGEHHINLLTNIRKSIGDNPDENTSAIIQSSGFGKSRTVDEMAKLVATIPMNIRDTRDNEQGAYPHPDEDLTKLFKLIASKARNLDSAVGAFHKFFAILFREFSNKVDALLRSGSNQSLPVLLRDDLAKANSRSLLYKTVCEQYSSGAFPAPQLHNSLTELGNLITKLKPTMDNKEDPAWLILYVDEAHTLTELKIAKDTDTKPVSDTGTKPVSTLYDAMVKAATTYCGCKFFILFLSTSSRLRRLAGLKDVARSARQSMAELVAPFTEMPFDCHSELQNRKFRPTLLLKDIQKHDFLTYFGRPLWASAFVGSANKDKQIRALAITKLMGVSGIDIFTNLTPRLAVLDTLLNLEYSPTKHQTLQLADDMVAGNMRTAFSVPTDRLSMYSGYPSEPVLAEAALNIIHRNTNNACQDPMTKLYNELSDDVKEALDVGQRGENVAKIILLRAYMAAVRAESANEQHESYPWANGCSLIAFLKQLTAMKYHTEVLGSMPDTEVGGQRLDKAFENAWVRFTHFARGTDDAAMTTSMAWVAFVRGMAVIGWPAQGSVDLHIPVLLHKDKPIMESNMSGILVQVKLRRAWSTQSTVAIDADKLLYFPGPKNPRGSVEPLDEASKRRPYISLVMALGRPVKVRRPPSLVVQTTDKPEAKPTSKPNLSCTESNAAPSTGKEKHPAHPRYSLFFYGRSHRVYGCIPEDQSTQDAYNALLNIGASPSSMFDAHPKGRDQKYVYQMKPFWTIGKSCFYWVEDEFLNHSEAQDESDEFLEALFVGDNTSMDVDSILMRWMLGTPSFKRRLRVW